MKAGKDDKSKCTVQAKAGRNGKVVFATLSPLGFLFPMYILLYLVYWLYKLILYNIYTAVSREYMYTFFLLISNWLFCTGGLQTRTQHSG